MSQADELLASAASESNENVTAGNIVIGYDRFITVPESLKKIAVQYDHDVETVTFDCPRYWDEHDLSTMRVYVNYMRSDGTMGSHLCSNVAADANDSSIMHFDWTISGHVTYVAGTISFLVCVKEVGSDGAEITHWNSELNTDMYVSVGMKCQETVLRRYPDIITQLLYRMDQSESIVSDAESARDEAIAAKNAVAGMTVTSETLASGVDATVVKSYQNEVYNLHFGLPRGEKGNGIVSIDRTDGTGEPGTTDTYTITLDNGETFTFAVHNGADAIGMDNAMSSTVYDPQGKATDIFGYVDSAAENIGNDISAVNTALENKADKSTVVSATLLASSWTDSVYTLAVTDVTATSVQEILPGLSITEEQLSALQAANIQDGGQDAGTIALKAFGDVPTIDIPIRVIVRRDM